MAAKGFRTQQNCKHNLTFQDRRRRLEDLWFQRKVKLEQHLQLLLLDLEVKKVSDWYSQIGDTYLANAELGDALTSAQAIQEQHILFEFQAKVRYLSKCNLM